MYLKYFPPSLVLFQRLVKLTHHQHASKELLVDVFHRVVTPLPQRQVTRLNRRGRYLKKKTKHIHRKRQHSESDNNDKK